MQFWLLALLGGCLTTGNATAQLLQTQFLEDPSGQMTLAQVQKSPQAFQTYAGMLTRGYTTSSYWIKLRIAATTEDQLVLRIRPAYLDHIELYDPLAESGAPTSTAGQVRLAGDSHPKAANGYFSLNQGFLVSGSRHARDVFLRIQSTNSMLVRVEVLPLLLAKQADHRQELLYSLYFGLLAAFMVWALLQWLASRELLVGVFLLNQAFVVAHALALQGYLPLILGDAISPIKIDRITSLLVLAYVFMSGTFTLMLLREFKPLVWLWRLCIGLMLIYLPIFVLFAIGQVRLALQINMTVAAVEVLGFLFLAISARAWHDRQETYSPPLPRWVLISFTAALVLSAYSSALPNLGGIDGAEWTLHTPMFGGFFCSLLMTLLLSLRARNHDRQRLHAIAEAHLQREQAQAERLRREEQERFLSMLTHELKTPLGVARISLDDSDLAGPQRARIDRALANINSIIDRCAITDQMEHHQLNLVLRPCSLARLIDECVQASSNPARVKVLESNDAMAQTDSGLLTICLSNLIDNALKYSRPDSAIEIKLQSGSSQTGTGAGGSLITVCNAIGSAGIPDPERLFDKYYRGPGASRKSGSGLGLYLTRSLVEMLGARVTYRAQPAHVEFCLWIPS